MGQLASFADTAARPVTLYSGLYRQSGICDKYGRSPQKK